MTEKEFRKLRPLDLIQLLLAQGDEVSQMQAELDKKNEKLALLKEGNDVLKAKLNDRDALVELLKVRLDKSDSDIRELERKAEELYADQWIDLDKMGSLTEAAQELYKIFEVAQHEAEQCLQETEQRHGALPHGLEHTAAIETIYVDEPRRDETDPVHSSSVNIEATENSGMKSDLEVSDEPLTEPERESAKDPEDGTEPELLNERECETESELLKEHEDGSEPELLKEHENGPEPELLKEHENGSALKESKEEPEDEAAEESEGESENEAVKKPEGKPEDEKVKESNGEPGEEAAKESERGPENETAKESSIEHKILNETHKLSRKESHKEVPHQSHRKKFLSRFLFGRHR